MLKTIIEMILLKKIHSLIVSVDHFSNVVDISDPQTVVPGQQNRQSTLGRRHCNLVLGTENLSKSVLHTTKYSMLLSPSELALPPSNLYSATEQIMEQLRYICAAWIKSLSHLCRQNRQLMATDCGIWLGANQNIWDLGTAFGFRWYIWYPLILTYPDRKSALSKLMGQVLAKPQYNWLWMVFL